MTDLDPILTAWRAEQSTLLSSFGSDPLSPDWENKALAKAKELSSPDRIGIWDNFRKIKAANSPRSIAENRWVLILLAADRAESVRARGEASKSAKKAQNGSSPSASVTLDDLLA